MYPHNFSLLPFYHSEISISCASHSNLFLPRTPVEKMVAMAISSNATAMTWWAVQITTAPNVCHEDIMIMAYEMVTTYYTHGKMRTHWITHIYIYTYTHTFISLSLYVYVYVCIYIYRYIYIIYIYTYVSVCWRLCLKPTSRHLDVSEHEGIYTLDLWPVWLGKWRWTINISWQSYTFSPVHSRPDKDATTCLRDHVPHLSVTDFAAVSIE